MICKPYKSCSKKDISQGFGAIQGFDGKLHSGVDFVSSFGTFLVAPELVKIINIVNPQSINETEAQSETELNRGFGIMMQSLINTNTYYLYWHCMPMFPVKIGDQVSQGQPVAQMGDSGFVLVRGETVPLNLRSIPPYLGTHLHAERFIIENNDWSKKTYTDITQFIDWSIPVTYDLFMTISSIITNISNFILGK